MLISKYLTRKKTSIQRIAELLIFMTWTVLCLFGIVGATNHLKSEQNLFELFFTAIQNPRNQVHYGIPLMIVMALIIFIKPTAHEIYILINNKSLGKFVWLCSFKIALFFLWGSVTSLLIFYALIQDNHYVVKQNTVIFSLILLLLYFLSMFTLILLLNFLTVIFNKLVGLMFGFILLFFENFLFTNLHATLFFSRGLWIDPKSYNSLLIFNLLIFPVYLYCIYNSNKLFLKIGINL